MRVKIEDVAQAAAVSTATVSLALNGSDKVSIKTRARVEDVARRLGYQPNPSARRLASRRSRQIGLVLPDFENIYYASLAQHALNRLSADNYALTVTTSMNSRRMEQRIISDMIGNQVEGLLIAPVEKPNGNIDYLGKLDRAGIPYIFVTSDYPNLNHPCVMCDLYSGMKALLASLYALGYRRISMLSGRRNVPCFDRRDGAFFDFMREHGLDDRRLYRLDNVRYDDSYAFVREMDLQNVDAIVCVNDIMALGAFKALKERGVNVPEDIGVAGFDDSIFSRVSPVPITTVRQDVRQMANLSADWILEMVQGEEKPREPLQAIPCEVLLRQSTPERP